MDTLETLMKGDPLHFETIHKQESVGTLVEKSATLSVYSRETETKVADIQIERSFRRNILLPEPGYRSTTPVAGFRQETTETFSFPYQWSKDGESLYFMRGDSLFHIIIGGEPNCIFWGARLSNFDVSDNEKLFLIQIDNDLKLLNIDTGKVTDLYKIKKKFGVTQNIGEVTWSPDGNMILFSIGWRVYAASLTDKPVREYKARGTILSIEWIDQKSIIIVDGLFPSDNQMAKTPESFRIGVLSLEKMKYKKIHSRNNHNPFWIKPKLSPSGKYFLFSERRLRGGYDVKLMSLDGKQVEVICKGRKPFWYNDNKLD